MESYDVVNCSAVDKSQFVGPSQVYASIYGWTIAVYVILAIHAFPLWIISAKVITGNCNLLFFGLLIYRCP